MTTSLLLFVGAPLLFALFVWWFGTGVVFFLDAMPRRRLWTVVSAASVAFLGAFAAIVISSRETTLASAYVAFGAAIVAWGWNELMFLSGLIAGPRRLECPAGAPFWTRFWCAAATIAHHELALLATLFAIFIATLDATNQVAFHVFAILWMMRLSAKLNLFLGVPNATDDLLPARLSHLKSYFKIAPMNPLFPVSVTIGTGATAMLFMIAANQETTAFNATSAALLGALIALAVLEHWFLMLPLRDSALWRWTLPKDDDRRQTRFKDTVVSTTPKSEPNQSLWTKRGRLSTIDPRNKWLERPTRLLHSARAE